MPTIKNNPGLALVVLQNTSGHVIRNLLFSYQTGPSGAFKRVRIAGTVGVRVYCGCAVELTGVYPTKYYFSYQLNGRTVKWPEEGCLDANKYVKFLWAALPANIDPNTLYSWGRPEPIPRSADSEESATVSHPAMSKEVSFNVNDELALVSSELSHAVGLGDPTLGQLSDATYTLGFTLCGMTGEGVMTNLNVELTDGSGLNKTIFLGRFDNDRDSISVTIGATEPEAILATTITVTYTNRAGVAKSFVARDPRGFYQADIVATDQAGGVLQWVPPHA